MKELTIDSPMYFTLGHLNQLRDLDIKTLNKMFHSFRLKIQYYIQKESNYEYKIKQSN